MTKNINLETSVVDAINRGQKVTAIKLLRESRGIGLKEAKDLVDQYCASGQTSVATEAKSNHLHNDLNFDQSVIDAINRGRKIEAIKLVRVSKGVGLKQAKELVEQYMSDNVVSIKSTGESGWTSYIAFILICGLAVYFAYKFFVK